VSENPCDRFLRTGGAVLSTDGMTSHRTVTAARVFTLCRRADILWPRQRLTSHDNRGIWRTAISHYTAHMGSIEFANKLNCIYGCMFWCIWLYVSIHGSMFLYVWLYVSIYGCMFCI
jgi:hypothetical protein